MNRVRPIEPRTIIKTITNAMMTYMMSTPTIEKKRLTDKHIAYKLQNIHKKDMHWLTVILQNSNVIFVIINNVKY